MSQGSGGGQHESGPLPSAAAILGAGEIGSGWAALFAVHGVPVRLFDRDSRALDRAERALDCARTLIDGTVASIDAAADLEGALAGADWVQESLPEAADIKREVLAQLDACLGASAIVASSTSSISAGELGRGRPFAARTIVAHPLHPVYAVPVVELSAGPETSDATVRRAAAVLRAMGREPVIVRGDGLVSNRLTAALLREAFDLVARGAISAADLDRLVARGIALGWAARGPLRTEAMGAGGSFEEFLRRFGSVLPRLWSSLADWSDLDPRARDALQRALAAETTNAHVYDECTWAETLARLSRVAELDV